MLIVLALLPNSYSPEAFSCYLVKFPEYVGLTIEAPWLYVPKILAMTKAPMSLPKSGITIRSVVVAAPTSKQWVSSLFFEKSGLGLPLFQLQVQ